MNVITFIKMLMGRHVQIQGWNLGRDGYTKGDVTIFSSGGTARTHIFTYREAGRSTAVDTEMAMKGYIVWPERITEWNYDDGRQSPITDVEKQQILNDLAEVMGPLDLGP